MKHSVLPTIAVESDLHTAAESASQGGQAVSGFAAESVHMNIARRNVRPKFFSSDEMLKRLDASLVAASAKTIGHNQ